MHSIDPVDKGLGTLHPNNLIQANVWETSGEPLNEGNLRTGVSAAFYSMADQL